MAQNDKAAALEKAQLVLLDVIATKGGNIAAGTRMQQYATAYALLEGTVSPTSVYENEAARA